MIHSFFQETFDLDICDIRVLGNIFKRSVNLFRISKFRMRYFTWITTTEIFIMHTSGTFKHTYSMYSGSSLSNISIAQFSPLQ